MSGLGALWQIRTCKHIRTMRSIAKSTAEGQALWPRVQETERQTREMARLCIRQDLHRGRSAGRRLLVWP